MKNYSKTTEDTLVTFHIGRGGRFHNSGFVSFCDQDTPINDYTDDLFIGYENQHDILRKFKDHENIFGLILDCMESRNFELSRIGLTEKDFGQEEYFSAGGSPVGLEVDNDGTGSINIDNDYDTTYVQLLKDCNEKEFNLILACQGYVSEDVRHLYATFQITPEEAIKRLREIGEDMTADFIYHVNQNL